MRSSGIPIADRTPRAFGRNRERIAASSTGLVGSVRAGCFIASAGQASSTSPVPTPTGALDLTLYRDISCCHASPPAGRPPHRNSVFDRDQKCCWWTMF